MATYDEETTQNVTHTHKHTQMWNYYIMFCLHVGWNVHFTSKHHVCHVTGEQLSQLWCMLCWEILLGDQKEPVLTYRILQTATPVHCAVGKTPGQTATHCR